MVCQKKTRQLCINCRCLRINSTISGEIKRFTSTSAACNLSLHFIPMQPAIYAPVAADYTDRIADHRI